MEPDECNSTDVAEVIEGIEGVTHVGLLRAGSARQVVAALADGQILLYRENGEHLHAILTPLTCEMVV